MSLTIVMYHYVRDLPRSRYPRVKGLLTRDFDGQLDYIGRHYSVCSLDDVLAAARGGRPLAPNSCLLTFDDGLIDHYLTVFPRLLARGWSGAFFPPAQPLLEHVVLDVHKIHLILAATTDPRPLVGQILELLRPFRREHPDIEPDDALYARHAIASRFDPAEVIFIKRMLQKGLPDPVRSAITDELFRRCVEVDESVVAGELYMGLPQLRAMAGAGMSIGGHGYAHLWLDSLDEAGQKEEIRRTKEFLRQVYGEPPADWSMCYPCGASDGTTRRLLAGAGCVLGFTTAVGLVQNLARPLQLERLDTNDLPTSAGAPLSPWTAQVLAAAGMTSH